MASNLLAGPVIAPQRVQAVTAAPALAAPRIQAVNTVSAAPVVAIPVTKALAAIPAATVKSTTGQGLTPVNYSVMPGPMNASPARPTSTAAPLPSGNPQPPPVTPQDVPFTPPQSSSWNPTSGLPAAIATPYDPQASQAKYFDPNLPPQGSVSDSAPDDSHAWHDPAPVAVVSAAIQKATGSSPGIANPQTSTALATVSAPSLWTRILTFLGFVKPVNPASIHGEKPVMTIERAAESLVRRIRNGDQNAMGLAVMIGENARKGDPTAQKTFRLMDEYIGKTSGASHAGERGLDKASTNFGWAKAVYLANGPLLRDDTIADVASSFGAEGESRAFIAGVLLPTHPAMNAAHHHGKVLGMARKIQAVRMPNSRISDYSATVGWELGE